jgi:glutathione S-transferase
VANRSRLASGSVGRLGSRQTGISAVNPNAKLPAIVDGDVIVFDSSAILLYLAEKTGKFLPGRTDKARAELLSWMFFVSSGVGPYFGQSVHFRNYAPEKIPYAINRYAFEAQRHAGILNARLGVALKDQHKFKTEMDAEALQAMFPHLKAKVA